MSLFSKFSNAISKTTSKISDFFGKTKLTELSMGEIEEIMLMADFGVKATAKILDQLKSQRIAKDYSDEEMRLFLAAEINKSLSVVEHQFSLDKNKLNVIFVCGVNGNGKTTTIGKLAYKFQKDNKMKVAVAACDTFRAAAIEQLSIWAQRVGCDIIKEKEASDPASVVYSAMEFAVQNKTNVLLIDTAGRLHNHKNLMDELKKITSVIKKFDIDMLIQTILVLDATSGQNTFNQLETFRSYVDISGLVISKLDGTAKAGSIIGLVDKFSVPIFFVGIGEKVDDLEEFDSMTFANAICGIFEK